MRNLRKERERLPKGRFWCRHKWKLLTKVSEFWYLHNFESALCECEKCGKKQWKFVQDFDEIPDEMIVWM